MADEELPQDGEEQKAPPTEDSDNGSTADDVESRFVDVSDELQKAFDDVKDKCSRRDLVSRRMQVRDAWEQRYFQRGNQILTEGPYGQWAFQGESSAGGKNAGSEDCLEETNIYGAYLYQLLGVLTQNTPSVRFFAVDNKKKADQTTACAANKLKHIIERENNTISVQEDVVRFLYTDSLAVISTEFDDKNDKQRLNTGGTLEWKLPMQVNYIEDCFYAIGSKEIDILVAKNKYPDSAKDIKPSTAPAAESEFERLARIACMQGMRPSSLTGDSLQWNVTEQRTYLKPDAYMEITDEDVRSEAEASFPDGVCLYHCGKTFCGARPARMDDELTLIHCFSGDGMHRNSIGKPLVNIQKKLNNAVELMQTTLLNTIPVKWTHPEYVDLPALAQQKNLPGSYLKLAAIPPDGDLSKAFYVEEQMQPPEVLMNWIIQLRDNFAQLLTGAYPALTGAGDLGGNDTAQGIATERDAAMGRIGTVWRNMKEGYASLIKNAVLCVAQNREGTISATIPARGGMSKSLTVDVDDLRGNVNCFPETAEAFPESWVSKRGVYMSLMSSADPQIEKTANLPENLVLAKEVLGVENFYIPEVVSRNKQLVEIDELLASEPEPNPKILVLEQHIQQAQTNPNLAADPQVAQVVQALQQQLQQIQKTTPLISSVQIDVDYDDHVTELQTVTMYVNSEEGQEDREKSPKGFANVKLHGMEHKAAIQAAAAQAPPPIKKPPTPSMNIKDMTPAERLQALAQAGIKSDEQDPY